MAIDTIARASLLRLRYPVSTALAIGERAGQGKLSGSTESNDVFIGYEAGKSVGDGQTFHTLVGCLSGPLIAAGEGATGLGQKTFNNATTADVSVAVGGKAGSALTSVQSDTFVGYAAAQFSNATNLGRRTFIGYGAGEYDNGDYNIAVGYKAGKQGTVNTTTTDFQIALGAFSLNAINGGESNIGIGHQTGLLLTSGTGNILIGHQAGSTMTANSSNICIGYQAGQTLTGNRNILLGEAAGATLPSPSSNYFIAGSSSSGGAGRIDNVFFGKGYVSTAPTAYTIGGTGGSGANIAGADIRIAGGRGTGTGAGGSVVIQVAAPSGSSSTLNTLTDAVTIRASDGRADFAGPIQISPGASVTPENNGDVVFELTNNTTLTIKARGADGVVRSGTVTLA